MDSTEPTADISLPRLDGPSSRRAVTWRSVLTGLVGVVLINSLTYYNDYAVGNTFLVGNYLPVGVLLCLLVIVLLINGPLSRFAPRWAMGPGELAVCLSMMLVSCTIPSSGLMRYLAPSMAGMLYQSGNNAEYFRCLASLGLPDWLLPTFARDDWQSRVNDPVVRNFWLRSVVEQHTFAAYWKVVPWRAWLTPAMTWGIFIALMYGAVICMSVIVRRQWVENERLAFPLATVYLSLIEPPPPGGAFNRLFCSRGFWIAFGVVFLVRSLGALHQLYPRYVPEIPLRYNLTGVMGEAPWRFTDSYFFQQSDLYFTVIGVSFFLQTAVAFSLWAFYVLYQVQLMVTGRWMAGDLAGIARQDQGFGALVAFVTMVLWIGRHHWAVVVRQMFRRPRKDDPPGRYMPYWMAGWGLLACTAGMVAWVSAAGASVIGAVVLVLMLMMFFLAVARIVAETGLLFVQFNVPLFRPWYYALFAFDRPAVVSGQSFFSPRSFYMAAWFQNLFGVDTREALSVYGTHVLAVADQAAYRDEHRWRKMFGFVLCLAVALAVGYVVAWTSTLYVEYRHAATLAANSTSPINTWGIQGNVQASILQPLRTYLPPSAGPHEAHSHSLHVGIGASVLGVLSFLRLRYIAWPLHPVGYLLSYTYPISTMWFSVMVGWLLKVLLVRFGGMQMFRTARGFFIGMIVGEAGVAGAWLVISLLMHAAGATYQRLLFLPG